TGRPVARLARAGTQIGDGVYAAVKRQPRAASASSAGVLIIGCPAYPAILGLCSSDIRTSRFCGVAAISAPSCYGADRTPLPRICSVSSSSSSEPCGLDSGLPHRQLWPPLIPVPPWQNSGHDENVRSQ